MEGEGGEIYRERRLVFLLSSYCTYTSPRVIARSDLSVFASLFVPCS